MPPQHCHAPIRALAGMSEKHLRELAEYGMTHRTAYQSKIVSIGLVETTREAEVWGLDTSTAHGVAISFATAPYAVDLLAEGRRVVATPGRALLVNPRTPFRRDATYRRDLGNEFLTFHEQMVADTAASLGGASDYDPERPFREIDVPLSAETFRRQRALAAYVFSNRSPDPLEVEEAALLILREVVRGQGPRPAEVRRRQTESAHRDAVVAAQEYIVRNLDRPLRLREIGAEAAMSPAHLCGVFRRISGRSVQEFIRDARLAWAYGEIPDYSGRLSELAMRVGYRDGNYFSSAFRRHFGVSPTRIENPLRPN